MKSALGKDGHVAFCTNFDTGKIAINADSAPIIIEIVTLPNSNPDLKGTVEGHIDMAGYASVPATSKNKHIWR